MSLLCPQCAYENPDQSGFCVRCGNRLSSNGQPSNTGPVSSQSLPTYAGTGFGSPAPSQPAYSPPPISSYGPSASSPYAPYTPASQSAPPSGAYPIQMGAGQGQVALRRAFAGYGTLILHHSWLINGGSEQASNARSVILDILRQRNIVGLNVNPQRLMERGLLMEERDYLVARRSVATMFIYATPAGKDLYISRATTVLPAISNVRVAIFTILFLIMFLGFFIHPSPYSVLSGDVFGYVVASFFSVLSIPILLFFIVILVRSFIYWLVEKDFWVLLRPNTLNDFQLDDIMLLEHVTDDTVKTAVQQIGLDASQITPPPMGYQAKRRIRTI
jgi:hypothetical protein